MTAPAPTASGSAATPPSWWTTGASPGWGLGQCPRRRPLRRPRRACGPAGLRRLPLPPRLRRRPRRGVRRPDGGPALRRGRHRGVRRRHPQASDDALRALVAGRVAEMRAQGTTTVEIKGGYGLTVDDEARSLRIAREFTTETTYLGAHVVPAEYAADRAAYLDLVAGPMLAAAAPHARWADVFCEPRSAHAFTAEEARVVLLAARGAGLELRVHGNQLGPGPGVQLAVELGAASVDHCTYLSPPTSRRSPARRARRSRPCCRESSSPRARPTPTAAGCSTPASRSPSPRTATPARATPRRCRS